MNRIIFLFLVFNLSVSQLQGQSQFTSYTQESNIITQSKLALGLWEYYSRYHIDSLNIIGLDLLKKHRETQDPFAKAVSYRLLGCYDVRTGSIERGLQLLNSSKSIFLNIGDEKLISEAYNEIGIAHLLLGDCQTARTHFENSLIHGRESGRTGMSYMAEINLAKSELKAGELISAKMLAEHYIRLAMEDEKNESIANAYSFLGQIALDENQFKRAEFCFNKQLEFAQLTQAPFIKSRALNNEAILHFMSAQYDKSLHLFQKVLEQRKIQNFHFYTCEAYMNIANFYYETSDTVNGSLYIDSCMVLAQQHHLLLNQIEALELMIEYQETPDLKRKIGLLYQQKQKLINDDLDKRKKLPFKEENQNIYLVITLLMIPIMIWWLYSKD